jgi:hypothetical protein
MWRGNMAGVIFGRSGPSSKSEQKSPEGIKTLKPLILLVKKPLVNNLRTNVNMLSSNRWTHLRKTYESAPQRCERFIAKAPEAVPLRKVFL